MAFLNKNGHKMEQFKTVLPGKHIEMSMFISGIVARNWNQYNFWLKFSFYVVCTTQGKITVSPQIVSYLRAKLWNAKCALCDELGNEGFPTFEGKHSWWPGIRYHHIYWFIVYMIAHISPVDGRGCEVSCGGHHRQRGKEERPSRSQLWIQQYLTSLKYWLI